MGLREPSLEVAIGFKGVGKTFTTNQIIEQYIQSGPDGRKGRPVLVFDINAEYCESAGYPGYKAIDFDVLEKNEFKRSEQIRKITVPGKYRILPYKKNRQPMNTSEMVITAITICNYFRNGMLVLEDINKYTLSTFKQDLVGMFIGLRHLGVDLVIHFQTLRAIPPKIWGNMNYLRWHKQSDSIMKYKQRVDNFELYAIAEKIVERQYQTNQRYYLWVSNMEEKLIKVTPEEFKQGCIDYLSSYPGELSRMMNSIDLEGNKKHKSNQEAISEFISSRSARYLKSE
jgi:hypothetical protein